MADFQDFFALKFGGTAAIALVAFFMGPHAQALTINGSSGVWSDAIGGSNLTYNTPGADGENQVRWGVGSSGLKSGLGFTGVGSSVVNPGVDFLLGELSHFNNPIRRGTEATAVDLTVALDIAGVGITDFDFTFNIDETPNNLEPCPYGDTNPCGDSIFWENAFSTQSFTLDDQLFTLELIGFGPNGAQTSFFSDEEATNTTDIYARINQTPISPPPTNQVPTPAAVLPILSGMFGSAMRKKKQNTDN